MKVWALAIAALSVTTAGCGAIDFTPRARSAQTVDMSNYFAQRLEAGRAHLAGGHPAKAIEAFRQASYDAALAPEAYNGMAVAYASLGREDVARDMFVRAIDLDPTDMRFRRNLAKVDEQIMLARQAVPVTPEPTAAPVDPAPQVAAVAMATPRIQTARPRPVRTAKVKEVFIRTQTAQTAHPAPRARVAERKLEGVVVRAPIMLGQTRPQTAQPVRIQLGEARRLAVAPRRPAGAPSGPIRIYLQKP